MEEHQRLEVAAALAAREAEGEARLNAQVRVLVAAASEGRAVAWSRAATS